MVLVSFHSPYVGIIHIRSPVSGHYLTLSLSYKLPSIIQLSFWLYTLCKKMSRHFFGIAPCKKALPEPSGRAFLELLAGLEPATC